MDNNSGNRSEGTLFDHLYRLLLGLYPAEFRDQFGEEMLATFAEARSAAREAGRAPEARVLLRELIALPASVLLAHARSPQTLQPQPVAGPAWPSVAGWTTIGCTLLPLSWLLAAPLGMLFLFLFSLPATPSAISGDVLRMLGFVTSLGLTSTIVQWFRLRRRLPHAGWWIPATCAGWLAPGLLFFAVERLLQGWLQPPWTGFMMLIFLTLPYLTLGVALALLMQHAAAARPSVEAQKTPGRSRRGRHVAALGLLLLLPLLTAGPWAYARAQLELAKRDGIYASPEEGFRIRAAAVDGAQLLRIENLESGPSWSDGRHPHVGFAAGRVYYDRPPVGWDRDNGYPGSYYIRVRGGWVHMSEGAFPTIVGRLMEIYHLEGAGEE